MPKLWNYPNILQTFHKFPRTFYSANVLRVRWTILKCSTFLLLFGEFDILTPNSKTVAIFPKYSANCIKQFARLAECTSTTTYRLSQKHEAGEQLRNIWQLFGKLSEQFAINWGNIWGICSPNIYDSLQFTDWSTPSPIQSPNVCQTISKQQPFHSQMISKLDNYSPILPFCVTNCR